MTTELKKRLDAKDVTTIELACLRIEKLVERFTEERRARFKEQTDTIRREVKKARQKQIRRGYCNFVNEYRQVFLIIYHERSIETPVSFALYGTWENASCHWPEAKDDKEKLKTLFAALPPGKVTISRKSEYPAYLRIEDTTLTLMPKGFRLSSKQFTAAVNAGKLSLDEFINWDPSLDDEPDTKE